MNQFLKFTLASCLGVVLSVFVIGFIGVFLLAGIADSASKTKVEVDSHSVLHLTFDQLIPEQTNNLDMSAMYFSNQKVLGLNEILETIAHAAKDSKIQGILINPEFGLQTGVSTASVLRNALSEFKKSGKFVVAYSKYYTRGGYYLSSVADKVYLNPLGNVEFNGYAAMIPFFKEMLDKVGIRMQVFYAGDYKSASEPYRLNKMSDENKQQLREYLEPVYANFLNEVGKSRGKAPEELRKLADDLSVKSSGDAVSHGLVDALAYNDEVMDDIRKRLGLEEKKKVKFVSLENYASSLSIKRDNSAKDRIALIYAEGAILPNHGERGSIVDDKYVKIIRKIREDNKYKAIVLRVNSPGGSALASENIWRELNLAKENGIKVVVSMGDYAASGGYYISCMADKIVASPTTLTGSIGVFSMIPNAGELFGEKLGIDFDTVKTSRFSVGMNPFMDLAPEEEKYMTQMTMDIYEKFLQRVADGRNMTRDQVHAIAQGRIWTGVKAKELGLVDELGDADKALKLAAELAGIEKYRLYEYPVQKEPIQDLIEKLTGQSEDNGLETRLVKRELGQYYPLYKQLMEIKNAEGVQARLPVFIPFR